MFGFLPNNLFTLHRGANNTGLSPRLWGRLSGSMMASDGSKRLVLTGDDFLCPISSDTYTVVYSEQHYSGYIDTGGTIVGLADEKGGVLALNVDATGANEETCIACGDSTSHLGMISDTAADAHLTCFECRYKINSITNSVMSHFVGLCEPLAADGDTLVDTTGALITSKSLIGFRTLLDGDAIDCIYQATDGSVVVVNITGAGVPVADTFIKVGFVYDPDAIPAKRITWYIDNVEQSTYVTETQIATATFPDAEPLTFRAAQKQIGATAGELALDWWAFGQLI